MIATDWTAVILGLAIGSVMSGVFFAGLAFGMRLALRVTQPVKILILSAALRFVLLLGVGWSVVSYAGPWAFAGYAGAFLILRLIVTTVVKAGSFNARLYPAKSVKPDPIAGDAP